MSYHYTYSRYDHDCTVRYSDLKLHGISIQINEVLDVDESIECYHIIVRQEGTIVGSFYAEPDTELFKWTERLMDENVKVSDMVYTYMRQAGVDV